MELDSQSKVIIEIESASKAEITRKLIELGAERVRFCGGEIAVNGSKPSADSSTDRVVIEAVLPRTQASSVVSVLSEKYRDIAALTIVPSISSGRTRSTVRERLSAMFSLDKHSWEESIISI